jgi:predicted nucleotidyltransferase
MTVSPRQVAEHFRRRAREREDREEQLRRRSWAELPRVADLLRSRYGVRRLWLFGSLLRGKVHERSDIDLAAEGLEPGRFFSAVADCMAIMTLPVDLIRIEDASPGLRKRIEKDGKPIRDR